MPQRGSDQPAAPARQAEIIEIGRADRLEWVDAMACDPAVGVTAFKIACIVGCHFNRHGGSAFLTQATLCRIAGLAERTVQRATRELEDLGYLSIKRPAGPEKRSDGRRRAGGRGSANIYRPACDMHHVTSFDRGRRLAARIDRVWAERPSPMSVNPAALNVTGDGLSPADTPSPVTVFHPGLNVTGDGLSAAERPPNGDLKTVTRVTPTLKENPLREEPLARLGALIGAEQLRIWFEGVEAEELGNGRLRLTAPTRFLRNGIQARFESQIRSAWQATHIEIVVRSNGESR